MSYEQDFYNQKIIDVEIEKEMKKSFIDYAMSVITSRALPDVRDGLKPVHRRILYAMYEDGLTPDKAFRKSATTVGSVIGKYHPHGELSIYDALVRLAQDFSMRYMLVEGRGNFGSIDGDGPAAYRYTEAKLSRLATHLLSDIDKETVDFIPNFDNQTVEPTALPSRYPNLLANGSVGIAVGMATNIPPHNLTEIIDAAVLLLDEPGAELDRICEFIKGPDFPTGGIIMGRAGIRAAYATGKGMIKVRARAEIEEMGQGRYRIVVTEIPYMVNKARIVENIAECVKDKRIDGISPGGLRDESGRQGLKIVVELKREANPQVVLNQLFKYTQLQDSFSVNMLALVDGQPRVLSLKQMLEHYISHQKDVVTRRTKFDLEKTLARAHILEGLLIAVDNVDEIIRIIRAQHNAAEARAALMERFNAAEVKNILTLQQSMLTAGMETINTGLTEEQANAILAFRFGQLTGLERERIEKEYGELVEKIAAFRALLADEGILVATIKREILEIRAKYGDERRTEIQAVDNEIDIEDLIKDEGCAFTLTHFGYIKRLPTGTYKSQRRGGRGIQGMQTREEDFVETLFIAATHDDIMFFTTKGRAFKLKGYQVPEAGRAAKGMNIINLLQLGENEKITAMIPCRGYDEGKFLFMTTRKGIIKRCDVQNFENIRKTGLIAIGIDEDDELISVHMTDGSRHILMATRDGMAIKFDENDVRVMGRTAYGVRGIRLDDGDFVVGVCVADSDAAILTVTENGYGKRASFDAYRLQSRGGKGLINYKLTGKTGPVAGIMAVTPDDDVMLITDGGTIIRMDAATISEYASRATQGVRLMRLDEGTRLISLAKTEKQPEDEVETDEDENDGQAEPPDPVDADE